MGMLGRQNGFWWGCEDGSGEGGGGGGRVGYLEGEEGGEVGVVEGDDIQSHVRRERESLGKRSNMRGCTSTPVSMVLHLN